MHPRRGEVRGGPVAAVGGRKKGVQGGLHISVDWGVQKKAKPFIKTADFLEDALVRSVPVFQK